MCKACPVAHEHGVNDALPPEFRRSELQVCKRCGYGAAQSPEGSRVEAPQCPHSAPTAAQSLSGPGALNQGGMREQKDSAAIGYHLRAGNAGEAQGLSQLAVFPARLSSR